MNDVEQLASLILDDPETGERMVISSDLKIEADGAMRFEITNKRTGRRIGVYLGLSELKPKIVPMEHSHIIHG